MYDEENDEWKESGGNWSMSNTAVYTLKRKEAVDHARLQEKKTRQGADEQWGAWRK